MCKRFFLVLFILVPVILFTNTCYSQVYGKIISRVEADEQFDSVLVSIAIQADSLQELLTRVEKNIMFKIVNDSVFVLDESRNVIFPEGKSISDKDVFTLYSKSVLNDLLVQGKSEIIFIEQRKDVLTITNGNFTLEYGYPCPPYCY